MVDRLSVQPKSVDQARNISQALNVVTNVWHHHMKLRHEGNSQPTMHRLVCSPILEILIIGPRASP